jgi:hypothetical protein
VLKFAASAHVTEVEQGQMRSYCKMTVTFNVRRMGNRVTAICSFNSSAISSGEEWYPEPTLVAVGYTRSRGVKSEMPGECRRILQVGGFCAFTVPMVADRLTMSRKSWLPSCHHASPSNPADCLVHFEYGVDAWKHVLLADFKECRIYSLEHPASPAFLGVK